jgi:lipid-binding SYLF domain-containing protein
MSNTKTTLRKGLPLILLATGALAFGALSGQANAATEEMLNRESGDALHDLYRHNPLAESIGKRARAILVFPKIVKAGLVFGGAYGEGELMEGSKVEYFNSVSGSWGWQIGAETYGYVVFLMNDEAVKYVHESHGWEIGVGPTVVAVDAGVAKNLTTSTLKDDAYAFIFDQQGLMASLSIEGTKISHIKRH